MGHSTIILDVRTAGRNKNFQSLVFVLTTTLSLVEQSSILPAKFDCPVARQNCSLFATAHDCENTHVTFNKFSIHEKIKNNNNKNSKRVQHVLPQMSFFGCQTSAPLIVFASK